MTPDEFTEADFDQLYASAKAMLSTGYSVESIALARDVGDLVD